MAIVRPSVSFTVMLMALFLAMPAARANFPLPNVVSAGSASGQFIVTATPGFSSLASLPEMAGDNDFVRLEPALLAVSADRLRTSFLQKIGVNPGAPWGGKIYLSLHPARSLNENIEIASDRFEDVWEYHVLLPDIVPRDRLARALTAVLLLEYADRDTTNRTAELPSWLVEGISQEMLLGNYEDPILSAPDGAVNGLPLESLNITEHGLDHLAGARTVFQNNSILSFSQLSWPTDSQLSGGDGGVYRASAQLFVDELLGVRNGTAKMRTMLELLPRYYNWQTALWQAYHENFSSALEVEKWWSLQTVIFTSRSPGPLWTPAVSREKLDEILSVPINFRMASNSLPANSAVSLQSVIRNFDAVRQTEILQDKLHELEIAQFRMAPSLAVLTAEYRNTLAGYLGEGRPTRGALAVNKHATGKLTAAETLKLLNALDAQRRAIALAYQRNLPE
ncbi:MAG TPA: hypothetical protein VNU95_14710 [Candidatus Acidoferrales bacterium]|jgi:hypothetical protein|nr:hypothetical protein [Candidatus Acidoferrales bacterium]